MVSHCMHADFTPKQVQRLKAWSSYTNFWEKNNNRAPHPPPQMCPIPDWQPGESYRPPDPAVVCGAMCISGKCTGETVRLSDMQSWEPTKRVLNPKAPPVHGAPSVQGVASVMLQSVKYWFGSKRSCRCGSHVRPVFVDRLSTRSCRPVSDRGGGGGPSLISVYFVCGRNEDAKIGREG
jgi:hypothetical protein